MNTGPLISCDLAWFPAYQSHHPRPVYSIFVRVITVNSTRHAFATALRQLFRFLQDRRQGQLILRYLLINGNAKAMNMSWLSLERGRLTTTGSCTSGGLKLKISSLALSLHVLWATFRRSTIVFQVGYHQDKYPSLLSLSFLLHGVIRACSSSDITHPPCTMHSIEFLLKRRIIWYILSLGVMRGCFPSSMGLLYPPYLNMSIRVRFGYTPHQCRCRTRIHLSSAYSLRVITESVSTSLCFPSKSVIQISNRMPGSIKISLFYRATYRHGLVFLTSPVLSAQLVSKIQSPLQGSTFSRIPRVLGLAMNLWSTRMSTVVEALQYRRRYLVPHLPLLSLESINSVTLNSSRPPR